MIDEARLVPYHTSTLPLSAGPWLVFAPHADDESFGMGGTLALAAAAGIAVHLVIMTDGSLGGSRDDLVNVREQEARKAATLLGLSSLYFLNQKDRGLSVNGGLVHELLQLIKSTMPAAAFFPGINEAHPDHRATAMLVWAALQSLRDSRVLPVSYEITGQSPINCLVDITSVMEKKKQVMGIYLSQVAEKNYIDIVLALNRLRTFTLGSEVLWAEGFYVHTESELGGSLLAWSQERLRLQLEG